MPKLKQLLLPVLAVLLLLVAPSASARIIGPDENSRTDPLGLQSFNAAISDESGINQQTTVVNQMGITMQAVLAAIYGLPSNESSSSLSPSNSTTDPSDIIPSNRSINDTGVIGALASMVGSMYANPAADTQTYLAYIMNDTGLGLVQPAYAQGIGFSALSPILSAWIGFRNLAYVIFVLVFLIIGFMIMTRQKLGSQTVITAQQAIPRVIVALLAVTFSYAIAGLMIDLMYMIMYLMLAVFGHGANMQDEFLSGNVFSFATRLVGAGFESSQVAISEFVEQEIVSWPVISDVFKFMAGLTVGVIIGIAVLFSVFSLFIELIKTYFSIVVSITLSPLLLMMGAIRGNNVFFSWLQSLFANLMAFPAVLFALLLFDQLTGHFSGAKVDFSQGGFMPPYASVGTVEYIPFILGLATLLMLKEIVVQVKSALGAKGGPFEQFGGAIANNLNKSWSGGQLVPGLGFTDTRLAGLTGKDLAPETTLRIPSAMVGAARSLGTRQGNRGLKERLRFMRDNAWSTSDNITTRVRNWLKK